MQPHILLVYEHVPESVQFYLIPEVDLDAPDLKLMLRCHGYFINLCDTPPEAERAMNWLSVWLGDNDQYRIYGGEDKKFTEPVLKEGTLISHVIVTGFIM